MSVLQQSLSLWSKMIHFILFSPFDEELKEVVTSARQIYVFTYINMYAYICTCTFIFIIYICVCVCVYTRTLKNQLTNSKQ